MGIKRIFVALLTFVMAVHVPAMAQDDTEYLVEIGPAVGCSFYMGDANNKLYKGSRFMGGITARYRINHRFALKSNLVAAGISGNTSWVNDRTYPEAISFKRTVFDLGVQIEGNFLAYGTTTYNDCHRLVPYYLIGVGMTFAPKPANNDFAVNFPIGIGVKYKIADRLNLCLEWTMRFSSSDRLDVTENAGSDPLQIKSGFMKNKDSYCFTMLTLTYDIFAKSCDCNE